MIPYTIYLNIQQEYTIPKLWNIMLICMHSVDWTPMKITKIERKAKKKTPKRKNIEEKRG